MYVVVMDVAVSALRAELARWIQRVRGGEQVVVTDRGVPVARLTSIESAPLIEALTQQGVLGKPGRSPRPTARGARRQGARGSVAELVSEQRR